MSRPSVDAQILLKATPPRLPKSGLFRGRLSCEGAELRDKALIHLRAPEGFGKTSLLGQWRREWLKAGAVVAWLTLDDRDDPLRFLQGLIVTMRQATGRAGFGQRIGQNSGDGGLDALTEWLAELADTAMDIVLVLDDAHLLPEATLQLSLVYLLRNLPSNLRLAIGARDAVSLPITDIAQHGQFILLANDELRYRLDETIALLTARFRTDIQLDHCARLHDLTEGWPLGLGLAMAVIEKGASLREAVENLSTGSHHIESYFIDALLAKLPPKSADLMVRISILDAIHPGLCQAMTGQEDADYLLGQLRAATPIFVEAVDSSWMRIHSLARRLLRSRFDALPGDERQGLHGRAAGWLAAREMYEVAAQHAFLAGDNELAYRLIEKCLTEILRRGHFSKVFEWMERLPAAVIENRTHLRLAIGWALALSDRHAEAAGFVRPVLDDPGGSLSERGESAAIISGAAFFADDVDRAIEVITPWFGRLSELEPFLRPALANQAALFALFRGATEQTRYHVLRAHNNEVPLQIDSVAGWAAWVVGLSYLWDGQVLLAEGVLRPALSRAEADLGRRSPVTLMLATALAASLWEQNLTGEAEAVLADRLHALERVSTPDTIIHGYLTAARLAAEAGQERRALDLLQGLYAIGEIRHLPRLCVVSLAEQIRLNALRSRRETCQELCRRLDAFAGADPAPWAAIFAPLMALKVHLAQAHAALAGWHLDPAAEHLDRARELAERLRLGRESVEIKLLRALVMNHRREDGLPLFREALDLAQALGLNRILADSHPLLVDWAARLRQEETSVQPAAAPQSLSAPAVKPSPNGLLTPKESEVLDLVARNMTNKEIGLVLDVGDETVKWHLKNLFGKFNAGTRKHLVDRARMLGILDTAN